MERAFYISRGEVDGQIDGRPLTPYRTTKEAALADLAVILGEYPKAHLCTLDTWEG